MQYSFTGMEALPLICLNLRAPLAYAEAPEIVPFGSGFPEDDDSQELLFCFELDGNQAARIDPDPPCFLKELVFTGKGNGKEGSLQLPAGQYLFVQQRRLLSREECVHLAIEQHKDGLWERHRLQNRLYIRFLFEDSSPVTQLFRPVVQLTLG